MDLLLTEKYRKEVSDILTKIGEGMGQSVIEKLQPEINTLVLDLKEFRETVAFQKEKNMEFYNTIKEKIDYIELKQESVIKSVFLNVESSNILLQGINKTVEIIPQKIQDGTDLLNNYSARSSEITKNIKDTLNGKVFEEFRLISERFNKIESDNKLELQFNEFQNRQRKMSNYILVLLSVMIVVLLVQLLL